MPRRSRRLLGLAPSGQSSPFSNEADGDDSESPEPFPFQKLPIELRYMIYELIFVNHLLLEGHQKEGCCINRNHGRMVWWPQRRRKHVDGKITSLLRTCKTLHEEATSFLYSRDFFVIQRSYDYPCVYTRHMGVLFDWLREIGPQNRGYLRSITFRNFYDGEEDDRFPWEVVTHRSHDGYYRKSSVSVAKLLANSANLQKLTTLHNYNLSRITGKWIHRPSKESKTKDWVHRACKTAENMYKDFRPMISQAIRSGRQLDDVLKLLMPHDESFKWYHVKQGRWMKTAVWTQEQADEGKAAMAEHIMLLLEKDLAYQRRKGWVQN